MFDSPIDSPVVSPVSGPWGGGGASLPRTGLIWYAKAPGMVDSIGISASDYLIVPIWLRSIFFSNPSTLRSAEDIITNIEASPFLNDGGELMGNATKGYALYQDGTSLTVLAKAYSYFKETQPPLYATDIKSLVTAVDSTLASPVGPSHAYAAAAGQVPDGLGGVQVNTIPPVHSAGYYGGPAYTNSAPSDSFIALAAGLTISTVAGVSTVAENITSTQAFASFLPEVSYTNTTKYLYSIKIKSNNRRYFQLLGPSSIFGASAYANFDLQEGTVTYSIGCVAGITPVDSDGFRELSVVLTATVTLSGICLVITPIPAGNSARLAAMPGVVGYSFILKNPLACKSAYNLLAIPPGQSVVSTVGTTTGNGVQVPLTGSDAANALSSCFSGGIGTVAVLMKMGAGSAEIPNSSVLNWLSVKDASSELLFSSIGASSEDNIALSNDGATSAAVAVTTWSRNEYHMKFVEFNGTKFRVGNKRYSETGAVIDANIVWSHATLAGGATFDGSFNPTTFIRWLLNSTVPNWMRVMMVSNLAGLGDTELLRRMLKYSKLNPFLQLDDSLGMLDLLELI